MASPTPMRKDNIGAHWKCLAACTLMSMCPFQYGVDFGIIGSLQAMKGFLEVCFSLGQKLRHRF
jgi:SP family sugar:H+ symporter-like MFS transporter